MTIMDIGLMIVLIIFIIYYAFKYNSYKKAINLFMVFFFTGLSLYGTKYPVYDGLQQFQQNILNIGFIIFTLILLFIGCTNKLKKSL